MTEIDEVITPIPNQPISFDDLSDECNESLYVEQCTKYNLSDMVYFQFRRGSCNGNALCGLTFTEGTELVTNGSFDTDLSGWTPGDNWAWNAGKARRSVLTSGILDGFLTQALPTTAGITYKVKFKVSNYSGGGHGSFGTNNVVFAFLFTANGNYTFNFTPAVGSTDIFFLGANNGTTTFDIDDVSVKVVSPECWDGSGDWEIDDDNNSYCHVVDTITPLALIDLTQIAIDTDYLIRIKTSPRTAGTINLMYNGISVALIDDSIEEYYFSTDTVAATTQFEIQPSSDYDGCILSIEAFPLNRFEADKITLVNEEDGSSTDLLCYITYKDNFATLAFTPETLGLGEGCYHLEINNNCEDADISIASNCISFRQSWDCHKLLKAYCDCQALGFDFTTFWLQHRVPVLRFNPTYPINKAGYTYSTGRKKQLFAERDKKWKIKVDKIAEPSHDTISAQLVCDHFFIDDKEYVFDGKSYDPAWPQNGKMNVAQIEFEVTKVQGVIYNNNCCGENNTPELIEDMELIGDGSFELTDHLYPYDNPLYWFDDGDPTGPWTISPGEIKFEKTDDGPETFANLNNIYDGNYIGSGTKTNPNIPFCERNYRVQFDVLENTAGPSVEIAIGMAAQTVYAPDSTVGHKNYVATYSPAISGDRYLVLIIHYPAGTSGTVRITNISFKVI